MLLNELLTPDRIKVPLEGTTKDTLLEELVRLLCDTGAVRDADEVLRAVREREKVLSTGIGHGVAIPHGRADSAPSLVMAAGITSGPVDFDALDGKPVTLVFLLVGPEASAGDHVKALSRISRLVRREASREALSTARGAAEFHAVLAEAERG